MTLSLHPPPQFPNDDADTEPDSDNLETFLWQLAKASVSTFRKEVRSLGLFLQQGVCAIP